MSRNLVRRRGDSFADAFEIKSRLTGAVIDISSGYTFLLTVDSLEEPPSGGATEIFQITGVITDGPNGIVEFAPSAVESDSVGVYFYDLQMTITAGPTVRMVEHGKYTITQDITK